MYSPLESGFLHPFPIAHPTVTDAEVRVTLDAAGMPLSATAASKILASPERIWKMVTNFEGYAARVPMISHAHRSGDRIEMELRFKVALFSAKFAFAARIHEKPGEAIELSWLSGEPRGIRVAYRLVPLDDGRATLLYTHCGFDIHSLGWLVKFFLRNHPEIQFGVFSGTALVLLDAVRRAVREG